MAHPMPAGWEQKYDANSRKYYYIDHIHKKTQWFDPRLRHPAIWTPDKVQILESMKDSFIDAPENVLREALIRHNFKTFEMQTDLVNAGYRIHRRAQHPQKQPQRQAQPPASAYGAYTSQAAVPQENFSGGGTAAASEPIVDEFAIMQVKGRFPNVSDNVARDILASCHGDIDESCDLLSSMGYEDRNNAEEKAAQARVEREAQEEERRKVVERQNVKDRLCGEFTRVNGRTVDMILESTDYNYQNSKILLQIEEAVEIVKDEFPGLAESGLRQMVEQTNGDVGESRRMIREEIDKAKEEAEAKALERENTRRLAEETIKKAKETLYSQDTTVKIPAPKTHGQRSAQTPSPTKLGKGRSPASNKDNVRRSVPDLVEPRNRQGSPSRAPRTQAAGSAGTAAPRGQSAANTRDLLSGGEGGVERAGRLTTLGPDPSLRRGPDKSLLSKRENLACGPDPKNWQGPNREYGRNWKEASVGNQRAQPVATAV